VAETGSVLLAENSLEGRVVSMLTLTHFVLVREAVFYPFLNKWVPVCSKSRKLVQISVITFLL